MATKLSPALKALINAPAARPGPCPAPPGIRAVYARIAHDAASRNLGPRPWVVLSAAATFTLNSPDSLPALHSLASASSSSSSSLPPVAAAELIREVGLKCISFNGIPRTINCLNAFRSSLPPSVTSDLGTAPSRTPSPAALDATTARGRALWDSIYAPFETKLYEKLALAHPDLPVHILHSHYAALLSDPPSHPGGLGRVLTSVVAVACLRAQTGVGPQVLSHVFGLRKAFSDGTYEQDGMQGEELEGARWLAGDEGCEWLLKSVDDIAAALGGSNFAQASKL
ncbi:hypothetical protein ISF_07969 [Cordyceps fumosorosea ARSEF 2679]|uniref:Mitochondrial protein n=1 Tax=Cordyceps fumosorosea (strain ARSEF 2679) TaxID=1081104 RepID=A0A167NE58_CORFA|nr:hypothetical protein ISF_07969 [Cordyceps fumosorosea ARSEF 2679]OAA55458.1 hypothetical protein ISF_07969 [Cordyceps fumosorosea ARSEF 2679]